MPASMDQLVFNDAKMQKLVPSKLQVGTYTTDTVKIVGSCTFYLVHPDIKKLIEVTFYVAINNGSVLLSCKTTSHQKQASLKAQQITPRKQKQYYTRQEVSTQKTKQEMAAQTLAAKRQVSKLITSKEMILHECPDVFEGIGKFLGPDYHIQINPSISPKQTSCWPIPIHLKECSNKK